MRATRPRKPYDLCAWLYKLACHTRCELLLARSVLCLTSNSYHQAATTVYRLRSTTLVLQIDRVNASCLYTQLCNYVVMQALSVLTVLERRAAICSQST
jgi:hypothetical protein